MTTPLCLVCLKFGVVCGGMWRTNEPERTLVEMNQNMLKAGRKPETDVFKKRKDQVEGK